MGISVAATRLTRARFRDLMSIREVASVYRSGADPGAIRMEDDMNSIRALIVAGAVLVTAAPAFAQGWPGMPLQGYPSDPSQGGAQATSPNGPSEAELRMRLALMQHSMGFGGIFAPFIKSMTQPSSHDSRCDNYSDYAACQAAKNGDLWAADRLQNNQSNGAERDWYNR
jgi:hypothetical protein